jgi:predicted TIM-barrel fold metal-dependent hydrolase
MTTKDWTISADSHIVEPPDLFTSRITGRLNESAPRVIIKDGVEWWTADGDVALPVFFPARAGDRFEMPSKTRDDYSPVPPGHDRSTFASDVRVGAYRPEEWLRDNAEDGVLGGVISPSMTIMFLSMIRDHELMNAVGRAYSDWALEFASDHPGRMRVLGLLNLDDIDAAVAELTRLKEKGAAGALIAVKPPEDRPYSGEEYHPLWAAAQDLDVALTMHVATNRNIGDQMRHLTSAAGMINDNDYQIRMALADIIMSGVFEKFPNLKIVSAENEGGWLPFFMMRMDWHYENNFRLTGGVRFSNARMPSDFIRSNVWLSFIEDHTLMPVRDSIGSDRLMWGNDFPHAEATFPRSEGILKRLFDGVPNEERIAMTRTNAMKFYGFDEKAILAEAER